MTIRQFNTQQHDNSWKNLPNFCMLPFFSCFFMFNVSMLLPLFVFVFVTMFTYTAFVFS